MSLKDTEPVRLSGYPALILGLVLLGALGWSQGLDLQQIVGQLAVVAITSVGGLEFARSRVDAPATVARTREFTRMAGYQQGVNDTRELDRPGEEGGATLDVIGGLFVIGLALLFSWALTVQVVRICAGIVKGVMGW